MPTALLYRHGLTTAEAQGRGRSADEGTLAAAKPDGGCSWSSCRSPARHRPLRPRPRAPDRGRRGIGRSAGRPAWAAAAIALIRRLRCVGIGGAAHGRAGLRSVGACTRAVAFAAMSRCCVTYRESAGIRVVRSTGGCWRLDRPDVFVGVDAPGLQPRTSRRSCVAAALSVVHFVSPSIWAWRGERSHQIRRAVDRMLLAVPVRAAHLRCGRHVVPPTSVIRSPASIPLVPDAVAAAHVSASEGSVPLVAVLPGSRARTRSHHIAPVFWHGDGTLARARLRRCASCCPPPMHRSGAAHAYARRSCRNVVAVLTMLDGRSHDALAAADVALVASGTATLEAALFKRPDGDRLQMRTRRAWLMRRIGRLPAVGRPAEHPVRSSSSCARVVAGGRRRPRRWPTQCSAQLDDPQRREPLRQRFGETAPLSCGATRSRSSHRPIFDAMRR